MSGLLILRLILLLILILPVILFLKRILPGKSKQKAKIILLNDILCLSYIQMNHKFILLTAVARTQIT